MQRLLRTDIRLWDLLGDRMTFNTLIYSRVLSHRRTLLFILLSLLTFFAADPSGARNYVPLWFSLTLWPIAFFLYLAIYQVQFLIIAAATQRLPKFRVPTPLIGLIALTPTVYFCEAAVLYISDNGFPYDVASQMIFYFLSVQGLETVFFRYIMPGVREEIEAATRTRHLVIGGQKIDLSKLLHIEAREHHVHLTFEDAKSEARARLSDIVAQTRSADGVQPHRSWWIARDPAIKVERKGGRMILRLRDDTEVPVARTRVDDVLGWLEEHVTPYR